jgi:predicted AAA+ superfamily ATPase
LAGGDEMIKRDLYLGKLIKWIDQPVIKIISGVRRSGKSFLLKMLQDELHERGVEDHRIVYVNFELLENDHLRTYDKLHDYIVSKKEKDSEVLYVFIDEVQNCDGWERAVASLLAIGGFDLFLTGSNANMLSGDLATHIAGRYIEVEVFPLTFSEFKMFSNYRGEQRKSDESLFNEYLRYGGFPGLNTVIDDDEAKRQYLKGIRNSVILKDTIQRHQIRDVAVLERVLLYIFDNVGQIFSAKRVVDYLKNIGIKASVESVTAYIQALEDSMIIHAAPRYDIKGKRILQRLDKYFLCDLGLRYADIGYRDNDISQLLENIVYMELLSRGYTVYVGIEGDREVDFIAELKDSRLYIQVTYLLATDEVINREYGALKSIRDSYPKMVLSMDRMPIGVKDGIQHQYLIDFLQA